MKISTIVFGVCLFCFSPKMMFAQNMKSESVPIEIGKIITIHSNILNEERQIYISLPNGYDTLSSNLPVIYVLDAEYRFGIAQSIHAYFGITARIPQAILIGIANPNPEARKRDYLPKSYDGEAQNFTQFLSEELFPFIEKEFKTSDRRFLVGHSNGGVFVVYTLLNNPILFEGYVAIDPSLKYIYNEGDLGLEQDLSDKNLYLASSDLAYGYLEDVAADMQADFAIFKNHLYQTRERNHLKFKVEHINDDHGNSYISGLSRGLRYIFDWRIE